MFGIYNNPDPRGFNAMQPHPTPIGMSSYPTWHMNQNYYTPQQPLPSYYPPAPGMHYHNNFHASPFDYQPSPYIGQPYTMPGQPMMDPYYDAMYKEPSIFDSCCPPTNPSYVDHMVPPYKSKNSMRQTTPDQYSQELVNNQPQSQTKQNRSSPQSQPLPRH